MINDITLLIVDDDPAALEFQKKLLIKSLPYVHLILCKNAADALDEISRVYIDLIILDIDLPEMDGFELYERINALYPDAEIPVIYLSGYTENIYIKKGFELGAVDYLTKPIDANLYINRIKLYLKLLSTNKELEEVYKKSQVTLDLVNRYVISSKADTKGIITEVTDAFCKISGFTRDELIGQPHSIVRHPDMSREVFKEIWSTIKSGKSWSGEVKNLKKDGSFYWVYAVISPMFDENGVINGYFSTRQDITADKEKAFHLQELEDARQKRIEAEKEAKEILESTDNMVIVGNFNECTYANKAFLDFFNVVSLEDFKTKHGSIDKFFLNDEGFFCRNEIHNGKPWYETVFENKQKECIVKMRRLDSDNEQRSFAVKVKLLDSELKRYLVIFDDVTGLEKERSFYQEAATHDHLTGIYNRFFFKDMLFRAFASAKRYEDHFSIMILDLDKFKIVNDTYGHLEGDNVLKKVAKTIQDRIRDSDIFARWGGEEFIILLPTTGIKEAADLANLLRIAISELKFDLAKSMTCSFGVTKWESGDNEKSLIKRADEALYKAKASGRNTVVVA